MIDMGFGSLQPANIERVMALIMAQREGQFCQHGLLRIAKNQRGFTLFILHGFGTQTNTVYLLVFARELR